MLVMPQPPTLFALGLFLLAFAVCCWHEEYTKNKTKRAAAKLVKPKKR